MRQAELSWDLGDHTLYSTSTKKRIKITSKERAKINYTEWEETKFEGNSGKVKKQEKTTCTNNKNQDKKQRKNDEKQSTIKLASYLKETAEENPETPEKPSQM